MLYEGEICELTRRVTPMPSGAQCIVLKLAQPHPTDPVYFVEWSGMRFTAYHSDLQPTGFAWGRKKRKRHQRTRCS